MERRKRRSDKHGEAVRLYLESVRARTGVEALAVAAEDGTLVAGAGHLNLDWMAALGASSKRGRLDWDGRVLHVRRMTVNQVRLYIASTGEPARDEVAEGLDRILAA